MSAPKRVADPDRAISPSRIGWPAVYPPRLGTESTQAVSAEAVMGDIQVIQLIAFVVVITTLLLALEIGLRRVQHRR